MTFSSIYYITSLEQVSNNICTFTNAIILRSQSNLMYNVIHGEEKNSAKKQDRKKKTYPRSN